MDDTKGAIYTPPKSGLPFLVVTFSGGDMQTQPTKTRSEARVLLAKRSRRLQAPDQGARADLWCWRLQAYAGRIAHAACEGSASVRT